MTPKIEDALNKLSATLTPDDLKKLNKKVEVDKADPEEVATKYLQRKGLIEWQQSTPRPTPPPIETRAVGMRLGIPVKYGWRGR